MNVATKVKVSKRTFSTAADIFAGIIKSKDTIHISKLPPPSYGGRHIISMLPGNFVILLTYCCNSAVNIKFSLKLIYTRKIFRPDVILIMNIQKRRGITGKWVSRVPKCATNV